MRRALHLTFVLITFCGGLAAGAWTGIGRRAAAFSQGLDRQLAAAKSPTPIPSPRGRRAYPTDEEMLTAIMTAVAENEPLRRAHRLHEAIGHLSPAELSALFARALLVEDHDRRDLVLTALLARWAAIDPSAAEAAVRPYIVRFRSRSRPDWRGVEAAVNTAWAAARPEAAFAEAMANPKAVWARGTANAALASLGDGDAARQVELLRRQPPSRLRSDLCRSAILALAEKDSTAAEANLDLIADPRQRSAVQAQILGKLAARDPAAGLVRLVDLAPDLPSGIPGLRLSTVILRASAQADPAAALAAVENLPEGLQSRALSAVLVGWAEKSPRAALDWAAGHGVDIVNTRALNFSDSGSFGDGSSYNPLVMTAFENDRAATMAWLRAQPASKDRDAMFRDVLWRATTGELEQVYGELTPAGQPGAAEQIVRTLYRNDNDHAEDWVKALPSGEARTAAIHSLAMLEAETGTDDFESYGSQWPAGPERDAALRGISSVVAREHPQHALDFARQISDPGLRELALVDLAQSWRFRDETAARAWLASTSDLSPETRAALINGFERQ